MANVNIRKRGKVYQYQFEAASVDGKRKQITKSGFKTKAEAEEAGIKALNDYINTGIVFNETTISYADYLDFWIENYCEVNLKYNTIQAYKTIIRKYLKKDLGKYRLASLTSVTLNNYITNLCKKYSFSRSYFKNILKVIKGTFRDACDTYGLIRYNPTITLRLPKLEELYDNKEKHIYTQKEIDIILEKFKDNDAFTCAFLTSCYTRS